MRKGTFSVQSASGNSSKHNSRELSPKYLIDSSAKNYYEQIIEDEKFTEQAKLKYKKIVNQNMQKAYTKKDGTKVKAQEDLLIKETVLTIKDNQNENDIKDLFQELNKEYGGHHLTEISIHRDEGHFLKNDIAYYPTKNILKKENDWFICSNQDIQKPKKEDFDTKVNINDFEKVFNYHAHAKFSMFDMNTGKTAQINKGQMSKRIKFVSDYLGLDYSPGKDRHIKKSVNQVKDEHLAKQKDLKIEIAKAREELQKEKAVRKDYAALEELNKNLKNEVKQKTLTIEDLNEHIQNLKYSLLNSKKENRELSESNNKLKDDNNFNDSLIEKYEFITDNQEELHKSQEKEIKVLNDRLVEKEKKNLSRPIMSDYDYKNDISRMVNVATEENTYIKEKTIFTHTEINVTEIKSPETLKDKFVSYFRDTYESLKEKYLDLKTRYLLLEKENKQLKKELSIYKPKEKELSPMEKIRREYSDSPDALNEIKKKQLEKEKSFKEFKKNQAKKLEKNRTQSMDRPR